MTNNNFARNADALESSNHAAELTVRAHAAVLRADTLATLLALSVEGVESASRGAREAVRDLLHGDLIATRNAYHTALAALGVDPLTLAA